MKIKLLIGTGVIAFFSLVLWGVSALLTPKPLRLINPTLFVSNEAIGESVYHRVRQDLMREPFIVIGYDNKFNALEEVIQGLVSSSGKDQLTWSRLILPQKFMEGFKNIPLPVQVLDDLSEEKLAQVMTELKKTKMKAIFILPEKKAILFGRSNRVTQLENKIKHLIFTINLQKFVTSREQLAEIKDCIEETFFHLEDYRSCAGRHFSKRYFRKKLKKDQRYAGLEKYGIKSHVLFYNLLE